MSLVPALPNHGVLAMQGARRRDRPNDRVSGIPSFRGSNRIQERLVLVHQ